MAAYAALVSLMHTIHQIQHHPSSPISLDKQQAQSLTQNVSFFHEFLDSYNSNVAYNAEAEADPLEIRIADAVHAAEDVIESYLVDNIQLAGSTATRIGTEPYEVDEIQLWGGIDFGGEIIEETDSGEEISSGDEEMYSGEEIISSRGQINFDEEISCVNFYQDLQQVIEEMDLIKMEVMGTVRVQNQLQRNVLAPVDGGQKISTTVVGVDDVSFEIKDQLTGGQSHRQVIPIIGMGGIGKTTLTRLIYDDRLIKERFDVCAWATISQQYITKEILCQLLSQAYKETKKQRLLEMSEEEIGLALYKYLSYRRYLLVMDDMWSIEAWETIQHFFPDNNNSSRILVTTRLSTLGSQLSSSYCLDMKFLNKVSSWNLFSETVFGKKGCPLQLEGTGKKIVESCRGLPLSIVVVGSLLRKLQRTLECWESIRKDLNSIVNSGNDEHCLKILKMSYNHLPAYLKPCFLYVGVFEEDCAIRVSTLIKLWVSERILKPVSGKSLETIADEYLKDLIARNLILVHKLGSTGNIKYCKAHDLLRDLCLRQVQKERFYNVIGHYSTHGLNRQRSVVVPRSTSEKDVCQSMSVARSFISCNKSVQLSGFRLLRTLVAYDRDTSPSYLYSLRDVFQLVNLQYLAVGVAWNSIFPSSVNLLWNLHTIVLYHSKGLTAPVEIWKLPQLRHVEFHRTELCLPDPPSSYVDGQDDVIMENLQTLAGVRNFKFSEEVVKRIPNIKKMRIVYDLVERIESHGEYYCLNNLECLHKLESFTCWDLSASGVNLQKLTFPPSLKKLNLILSELFSWEDMLEKIGLLPLLQKLTLRGGYFRTSKWETVEGQFPSLRFLSLRSCGGLECWETTESSHFPLLEHLQLRRLRLLEEIPSEIGEIPTLKTIELISCSESAMKSAKKIVVEQQELQGEQLPFHVQVLLWEKNEALQSLAAPNFEVKVEY